MKTNETPMHRRAMRALHEALLRMAGKSLDEPETPAQRRERLDQEELARAPSAGVRGQRLLDQAFRRLGIPVRATGEGAAYAWTANTRGRQATLRRTYRELTPGDRLELGRLEGRARRRAMRARARLRARQS